LMEGYETLHRRGFAHSIEAYADGVLVGGLYGVALGRTFFGESMFANAPDASKCAFAVLLAHLLHWGFTLVDCQVHTEHLERFGAVEVPRAAFLRSLRTALSADSRVGTWRVTLDPDAVLAELESAEGDD